MQRRNVVIGLMIGYCGCDARGISISACDNIILKDVLISKVLSRNGSAIGIDIMNSSSNIHIKDGCRIEQISALVNVIDNLEIKSLHRPSAIALRIDTTCRNVTYEPNLFIDDIKCGNLCTSKVALI